MQRLIEAIERTGNPSVVGLDPTAALIPSQLLASSQHAGDQPRTSQAHADAVRSVADMLDAVWDFNTAIIDAISDIVPAVKPQIAMYEALGPDGVSLYARTCAYAQERGLYVIGDIKRGDIGSTATAYATHLAGFADGQHGFDHHDLWHEDAVTVNPYLGTDGIEPFIKAAVSHDKDVFVLVRTSNPSSSEVQELKLSDGRKVYQAVADLVERWGGEARHAIQESARTSARPAQGVPRYSRVGAVVGATHAQEGSMLRSSMPHTFFLVPGYGAQGGTADDVAGMFDARGTGSIVNSSRGIIGAWRRAGYSADMSRDEVLALIASSARTAALSMKDDLTRVH